MLTAAVRCDLSVRGPDVASGRDRAEAVAPSEQVQTYPAKVPVELPAPTPTRCGS